MSSINHQYEDKRSADGNCGIAVPPLPVLIELAGLVWALALETAKAHLSANFSPVSRRYFANPRAGAARMLRAFADRINKE